MNASILTSAAHANGRGTRDDIAAAAVAAAVAAAIGGGRPREEVLALVAREAAARVDADIGTVGRVLGDVIEVVASWTHPESPRPGPPVGAKLSLDDANPPAEVARTGRSVLWGEHAAPDERSAGAAIEDPDGFDSGIIVPIVLAGSVWGHIGSIAGRGRRFADSDLAAIEGLAAALAPTLGDLAARATIDEARAFFQLSSDLFCILDLHGAIRRVNSALEETLRLSGGGLVGSLWSRWVHPDDRGAAAEWFEGIMSGDGNARFDGRFQSTGGEHRILRWSARLDTDGGQVFAVARDVTDEVGARVELEGARLLQESILEAAGEGIYGVDLEGLATFVNPAAARMLGFTPDELIGRQTHTLIHHSHPDGSDYPIESCAVTRALFGGAVRPVSDEVFWRKDGSSFPAEFTTTPIFVDGRATGAVITFSDISNRLREEHARQEAAVEANLRRQNAELSKLAARFEESNADLEQFAYVTSHDLQAPLRAIVSHIELIEEALGDGLDPEAREDMGFVVDGARRMQRMIEGLLAFSSASRQEPSAERVNLDLALDDALRMLGSDIENAGATVVRTNALPAVPGDEAQLARVFQNLVENALRYGPGAETLVSVEAERVGPAWCVRVDDNGGGVPVKHRERIFDMFQRLHTPGAGGGIGMGLALCRRIVERHGGSIWVEESPGGGASFRFTLPASFRFSLPSDTHPSG